MVKPHYTGILKVLWEAIPGIANDTEFSGFKVSLFGECDFFHNSLSYF